MMRKAKEYLLKHQAAEDLSVDGFHGFLNKDLLAGLPGEVLARYEIELPVWRSTAWSWMKKLGCLREEFKQGYYNDNHGSEFFN